MHPRKRSLLAALVTTSVVSALLASAPTSAVADDKAKPRVDGRAADRARATLVEARSLFDGKPTRLDSGRDATMVLRDLVLVRDLLTGAERLEADRLLARPTDGPPDPGGDGYQAGVTVKSACTTVCVHWVESSGDGVSPADTNVNGRSDYVDAVIETMTDVHATYLAAGYRAPKPDGMLGGDAKPDIYLANIGDDDLYGYCTTDDVTVPPNGPFDAWAYCVLDNDYSPAEFPTNTPLENMQVTAAHEYFHAVQFAYDFLEDNWFMEATATWVEDEMYDDVNDNLNYLTTGPLAHPSWSLDTFDGGGFQYGSWIFFRYLTEQLPAEVGGLPSLVRDMWALADGAAGGPDQYSMQAVASVLKQRGTSLPTMFAAFADGNRRPGATYSEGAVNGYPAAPFGKFVSKSGWFTTKLDHMSSATGGFAPQAGASKLKIFLDMPPKRTGSAALVTVISKGGQTKTTKFALNKKGNGAQVFPFSPKSVTIVEVTLVNTGAKYKCWQGTSFSCQGIPTFDNMTSKVRGALIR